MNARIKHSTLLGVATATAAATVLTVAGPASPPWSPAPTALLAASQRAVDLTAASSPYQLLQSIINAVLPPVVNTIGGKPKITLHSLLAQIPADLLTDVLNANGGAINVNTLLGAIGTSGTDLNSTVSNAITSALSDYLATATTGQGAADLKAMLSGAISSAVVDKLNGVGISVPGVGSLTLAQIVGASGINNIANTVANSVAGSLVNNLSSILPTPEELAADITPALPNLLNTVLSGANLTDPDGNFQLGNLLNLLGVNLAGIEGANALTVTSAGPLFTLARLFGGVDLGWVPGTQSAVANSVNSTGYLDVGTSTLKTNLAAALAGVLSDGSLAAGLTDDLTPVLNTVVSQIVDNATETLQTDLQNSINDALDGLNYSYTVNIPFIGSQTITVPVGDLLKSAVAPLIGDLASGLNSSLQGSVSGAIDGAIGSATGSINDALGSAVDQAIGAIPDLSVANLRIPIVLGAGLGAFSAGAAYKDVLAKLASQPGGVDYTGTNPLLGSLTIMPELLLNNAGRANGGMLARFSSLLKFLGVDAVTPDVAISSSGGTPVGDTGLALGGANLIPLKIDATAEYQLMSDFAAWPNPVTLVNNVMAGLLPTYLLRGLDGAGALGQVTDALESLVGGLVDEGTVDPNIYLTLAAKTLPMLEPLYLAGDVLHMVGLHPIAGIVDGLANAFSPVLTSLVNLGYSDAYWNPATSQYERTLDTAAQRVQFFSFPKVNWVNVLPNLVTALVKGFKTAFTGNTAVPNALQQIGSLLNGGGINGLIDKVLSGVTGAGAAAASDPGVARVAAAAGGLTVQNTQSAAEQLGPQQEGKRQQRRSKDIAAQRVSADNSAAGESAGSDEAAPQTKAQRRAAWQAKHDAAKQGTDADKQGTAKPADSGKKGADHAHQGKIRNHDNEQGTGKRHLKSGGGKHDSHKQGGKSKVHKHAA